MDWRDRILKAFVPQLSHLTLVADPDGLLLEEELFQRIHEKGFELLVFENSIAFRYAYESTYRALWDRGKSTELVVILNRPSSELENLPYDLLQTSRRISFSLAELFPDLSDPVITALDRGDLDALYQAQMQHRPKSLGENASKDFVLRHVFDIAPELIQDSADLLRVLLRRHYRGQRIPAKLDQRFIQILRQNDRFNDWPLEIVVPQREAFFSFLQERWPAFLDRFACQGSKNLRDGQSSYQYQYRGPLELPFDHDDVRVYIDNLFLEDWLQPVSHDQASVLSKTWVGFGVRTDPEADRVRRLAGLLENMETSLPAADARHDEWQRFAYQWAELILTCRAAPADLPPAPRQCFIALRDKIDVAFQNWLQNRYAGLHSQPPLPPVMLHHIPRAMARQIGKAQESKVAFLLVDGLALDQWLVVREVLREQRPKLNYHESAIFAWIPTITSVSRQAAFAGQPPVYFPGSIQTTSKERALWTAFWLEQGLNQRQVIYEKGLGQGKLGALSETLAYPKLRVAGLIINTVDDIMHGMQLGSAGMHNQVRQWTEQGYLVELLDLLLDKGFEIWLSADHGNVEATGYGRPAEGAVAELRGERVRVFRDSSLRTGVKSRFPNAIEWPSLGLPPDYLPLLAPARSAFLREGETLVGHGGISLEEVIVPLIQIERSAHV